MSRKLKKVVASSLALAMMAGTASTMPVLRTTTIEAAADEVTFSFSDLTVDAGASTARLALNASNNGGYSALQGDLIIEGMSGYTVSRISASDGYEGTWSPSKSTTQIQFVSASGHNVTAADGKIASVTVNLPDGVQDGTYKVYLKNVTASKLYGTQDQRKLDETSGITVVAGTLTVGAGGPVVTQAPSTTTKPVETNTPPASTGSFGVALNNANGTVGGTVKTTLDITANAGVAGFTVNLSHDTSALKFSKATAASGWQMEVSEDGTKLVFLADPYQDVTTKSTAVTLEYTALKAATSTIKVNSVEASTKAGQSITGTGSSATVTVTGSGSSDSGNGDTQAPEGAYKFKFENVEVEAGATEAKIKLNVEGSQGFSALQGDFVIVGMDGYTVSKGSAGDGFEGQWSASKSTTLVQFVSSTGHNVGEDGASGKVATFTVKLPDGVKEGSYKVYLANMSGSKLYGTQDQRMLSDGKELFCEAGTLTVGAGGEVSQPSTTTKPESSTTPGSVVTQPSQGGSTNVSAPSEKADVEGCVAGPTVYIDQDLKADAGKNVTFKIKVKDNDEGYSSLITWLDIDTRYFELVTWKPGDPSMDEDDYEDSTQRNNTTKREDKKGDIQTLVQLFMDANNENLKGDNVYATVTLKVKDTTPDGQYVIHLDGKADGKVMGNRIADDKSIIGLNPTFNSGIITVGDVSNVTTPSQTTPQQTPSQTTPAVTTPGATVTTPSQSTPDIPDGAYKFQMEDVTIEPGTTEVKIKLNVEGSQGFSALQGDFIIVGVDGYTVSKASAGDGFEGQWSASKSTTLVQFVSSTGHNVGEDGASGKVATFTVKLPEGVKEGQYKVLLQDMSGSKLYGTQDQRKLEDGKEIVCIPGTLTVGVGDVSNVSTPGATVTTPGATVTTPVTTPGGSQSVSAPSEKADVAGCVDGPTVYIDQDLKANAGENVTFKIKVKDNDEGYSSLIAWLDIDTRYFELVTWKPGDPSMDEDDYEDSTQRNNTTKREDKKGDIQTLVQLFMDANNENLKGDNVYATVTLKVKDTTPDGQYVIHLDGKADGKVMGNRIAADKSIIGLNPTFNSGIITVGDVSNVTTPGATVTTPEETTPQQTPTETTPVVTTPGTTVTTPSQSTPAVPEGAYKFQMENTKVDSGASEIKIKLNVEDSQGFSALQGDFIIEGMEGYTVSKASAGDGFEGQWSASKSTTLVQFVSSTGHNVGEDGASGKVATFTVKLPEGVKDGTYKIYLKDMSGSKLFGTQDQRKLVDGTDIVCLPATLTIGEEVTDVTPGTVVTTTPVTTPDTTPGTTVTTPVTTPGGSQSVSAPSEKADVAGCIDGPTVYIDQDLKANAGENVTFKIKVKDNDEGYSSLIAWLDIDTRYFELVTWKPGDPTMDEDDYEDSTQRNNTTKREDKKGDIQTLVQLFMDANNENLKGDNVYATVTLKVKDSTPDGQYVIHLDGKADGKVMANRIAADKSIIGLNPTFNSGIITVGDIVPVTTPGATVTTPEETTPQQTPTETTPVVTTPGTTVTTPSQSTPEVPEGAYKFKMEDTKVDSGASEIKIKLNVEDSQGFSALQGEFIIEGMEGYTVSKASAGDGFEGQWSASKSTTLVQFVSATGHNVGEDGASGKVATFTVKLPEGVKDGTYKIYLKDMSGSKLYGTQDQRKLVDGTDLVCLPATLTIGEEVTDVTPEQPVVTTTVTTPVTTPDTTPGTTVTTTPVITPGTPDDNLTGDVNGDGSVNATDIVALKRYLLLADAKAPVNGDVNGDGSIDAMDLVRVVNIILNK